MARKYSEFSNFILRAGSKRLLDLLDGCLVPSLKQKLISNRGEVYEYKFLNVEAAILNREPVIFGRLVQRMRIKARQRLNGQRLRATRATMASDPSSIFVLMLTSHKLIIIPEQPRGPRTSKFKFVIGRIIQNSWMEKRDRELEAFRTKLMKRRLTKEERESFFKKFLELNPRPSLEINPISAPSDVAKVMSDFDFVRKLRITYFKSNNEDVDTDEKLIDDFNKSVQRINSDKANQEYINTKSGLKVDEVGRMLQASAKTGGNSVFRVDGSLNGVDVVRTDENTQIVPVVDHEDGAPVRTVVSIAIGVVNELIRSGVVKLGENTEETSLETALKAVHRISK